MKDLEARKVLIELIELTIILFKGSGDTSNEAYQAVLRLSEAMKLLL